MAVTVLAGLFSFFVDLWVVVVVFVAWVGRAEGTQLLGGVGCSQSRRRRRKIWHPPGRQSLLPLSLHCHSAALCHHRFRFFFTLAPRELRQTPDMANYRRHLVVRLQNGASSARIERYLALAVSL